MAKQLTPNEIGHGYDALADLLDQLWGENLHHGYWEGPSDTASLEEATNRLTDKLAGMLDLRPGHHVLDLGCGIGQPAIRLGLKHDVTIVGVSISERQIERANDRAYNAELDDRLSFEHADAMDLPFAEGSFDVVWALESIHHMPDRAHVLTQAAKVLRPGGQLAIGDFVAVGGAEGEASAADGAYKASQGALSVVGLEEYAGLIRAAGLEPLLVEDVSKHTRQSWAKGAERFTEAREQVVALIGEAQFDATISRFQQLSEVTTLGYALLTARKPS